MKIAVLFSSYGPYHLARVNAATIRVSQLKWEIVGVELSRKQIEYPWVADVSNQGFPIISVFNDKPLEEIKPLNLLHRLGSILASLKPDVIVLSGYFRLSMIFALAWGKLHGKKIILCSESTEIDFRRNFFKEFVKQKILSFYNSALVGGQPQRRYLEKLGVDKNSIFLGYNVVGNNVFHPSKQKIFSRPIKRKYFLSVNRFIEKKNICFLIRAYSEYRKSSKTELWDLVLCGDGELRGHIHQQVDELGLEQYIHFPGFLQQDDLLPYFAHAECFVHASTHEQWGLVVNEAMASGLPVLVSNRCGCVEDLVVEDVNGFSFDPYDQRKLTCLLNKVSSQDIDLETMSLNSLERIEKFSPNYFAQGLQSAIEYSLLGQQ